MERRANEELHDPKPPIIHAKAPQNHAHGHIRPTPITETQAQ